MAARRIFLVDAHPDEGSLCSALAEAYADGARTGGHDLRVSRLRELRFDLVLRGGYHGSQPIEPELAAQRELLPWCEHLVIVTPNWWWSMPALLKGWVDRVFVPGIAMRYHAEFPYVVRLMRGRSARVIYTQNSPFWAAHTARGDLFWKGMRRAVLRHCGFGPVRRLELSAVELSTPEQRRRWLEKVRRLGQRAH